MALAAVLPGIGPAAYPPQRRWSARGLFTVAFLGIAAGIQMSDRGLQAILLGSIQETFQVGDGAIGALQGLASILVASALAVPLGRLADRGSRKRVLLGLIAGWTMLMALSALAPDFPLFFAGRAAAGVTEFAMIPIVYAIIPDLAPERHRVAANLSFAAMMACGASAGLYFGPMLVEVAAAALPAVAPWRAAMLALALTGVPLLLVGLFTAETRSDPLHGAEPEIGKLLPFLRTRWRALGLFMGVAGFLLVGVQALNPLIALALERRFAPDMVQLGHMLGIVTLAATLGCLPVAGTLDAALTRRFGVASRPAIMGAGAAVALPCALLLGRAEGIDTALACVAIFLFATCVSNALVPTMLQDLTPDYLRARSFALWSFVVSIFSAAGPLATGVLSDRLPQADLLQSVALVATAALLLSLGCALASTRVVRETPA